MRRLLVNAQIVTSDDAAPHADAIEIDGETIAFVGSVRDWSGDRDVERHDMGGRLILPGLIDAHTHPSMVVESAWHTSLPATDDVEEILEAVRRHAAEHPVDEAPYLRFEYYPSTLFGDGAPTRQLLDAAVSDRPVLLQDFSDHAQWVNTRMIELLGVTRDTPDPVPGLEMFVRDGHGEPTGHVLEMAHLHFIDRLYDAIGWRPPTVTAEGLETFFDELTGYGVTAVFEAVIHDEGSLAAVAELDRDGRLPLRYEGAVRFRTRADLPASIATVRRYSATHGSDRVRIRTLKLFLDGTNESGNSALLDPLATDPTGADHGEIQIEADELTECLVLLNDEGLDVHIHMVGDRAFRTACDAVEAATGLVRAAGGEWRTQVTFAHCELIDPADMSRPAELGIIVNWTTHWSGGYFGEEARTHLGAERWGRMYDFDRIAESGALLTFGSDVVTTFEAHRANPFLGMQIAATRVDTDVPLDAERYAGSVRPDAGSRLSVARLIRGHTIDAARQLRIDDRVGSLEVGKVANLVVLDEDVFDIDAGRLGGVRPAAVILEGRLVVGGVPGWSAEPAQGRGAAPSPLGTKEAATPRS